MHLSLVTLSRPNAPFTSTNSKPLHDKHCQQWKYLSLSGNGGALAAQREASKSKHSKSLAKTHIHLVNGLMEVGHSCGQSPTANCRAWPRNVKNTNSHVILCQNSGEIPIYSPSISSACLQLSHPHLHTKVP
jgi:hypothetical protein